MSTRVQFRLPEEIHDILEEKIVQSLGFKSVSSAAKHAFELWISQKNPEIVEQALSQYRYKEHFWLSSCINNVDKRKITGRDKLFILCESLNQIKNKLKYYKKIKCKSLIDHAQETQKKVLLEINITKKYK